MWFLLHMYLHMRPFRWALKNGRALHLLSVSLICSLKLRALLVLLAKKQQHFRGYSICYEGYQSSKCPSNTPNWKLLINSKAKSLWKQLECKKPGSIIQKNQIMWKKIDPNFYQNLFGGLKTKMCSVVENGLESLIWLFFHCLLFIHKSWTNYYLLALSTIKAVNQWNTLLLNEGIPRALKGKKLRLKNPLLLPLIFEEINYF